MTGWRNNAAAALLLDGHVLIVGGNEDTTNRDLASAELFDPKTNTFSATGSMYQPHGQRATATLLLDGRVLVVGGADQTGMVISSDAELYDPATGKFSETGQTIEPAWYHTATRLPDGRVLVITSDDLTVGAHSQIYDPATGRFSAGAAMTAVTMPDVAILLKDGRVLVAGARATPSGGGAAAAELFDPASGTFSPTGPPAFDDTPLVGTLLADGRAGIVGDVGIQTYDPATGKFTLAASLHNPKQIQGVITLRDGRVLVTYQWDRSGGAFAAAVYDPATGETTRAGSLVEDRDNYTATLLPDGRVLIAGGALYYKYVDHNVSELFDPKTNTFRATDS
jgi:hypothetical protein